MAKGIIRIDQGRIIPFPFRFVGTILLAIAYFYLLETMSATWFIILGILISPLLPLLWTARQILEINSNKKIIHSYAWIMGGKIGKPESYREIDKIFMNATHSSQRMTSWGGSVHTARYNEFVGFIKFGDERKIELVRDKDKEFVVETLRAMANKLNTPFVDQSNQSG